MGPSSPASIVSKAIGNRATTSNLLNQMTLSAAQQKYYAYWLTRSLPSDSLGKLTASLQDAQVDLTPHQIDAALFASNLPRLIASSLKSTHRSRTSLRPNALKSSSAKARAKRPRASTRKSVSNASSKTLKSAAAKNASIFTKPKTKLTRRKKPSSPKSKPYSPKRLTKPT